jgi:ubiquinone/menaquinone biosynthesis C-methylase UbiE
MVNADRGTRPSNLQIGVPTEYGFALTRQRFELTMPHIRPDAQSLLDVGCGNGANTALFAQSLARVAGVDVEPERLQAARDYAREHGLDNVEYAITDGRSISYPDSSFDHVTCFDVLEHVEDEQQTLSEIARVLRPGGVLSISVPNKWYLMEVHGFRLKPESLPWNRVPLLSWLPTPIHERYAHARIYTKRRILTALSQARFEVASHEYVMPPFDLVGHPAARRALTGTFTLVERTPLRVIGLRHFITATPAEPSPAAS